MAGPLNNIIILDLTWILSGPYCTMILADLGAEVIKIERPGGGDKSRGTGPFVGNESAYFMSLNRGKKSVTIDLRTDKGRNMLLKLVKKADVLVENFVPGAMKRLKIDYEVLKKVNPGLVYCAISGFGQTGPYKDRPALDIVVQAMGGIMGITGEEGGDPLRPGASLGDIVAGMWAAIGIVSALKEKDSSGLGQMVDISMLDGQIAILENAFSRYFASGEVPGPTGTRHPSATPFQAFETQDGWIVVAIFGSDSDLWGLFCAALDLPDLIDDNRFEDSWSRTENVKVLEPIISKVIKTKTTEDWLQIFLPLGIACGPVNRIDEVVEDPQVIAREMIQEAPHKRLGKWKFVNTPLRLSRTLSKIDGNPPDLGEHNEEVFGRFLGMSKKDVNGLHGDGVI